MQNLPLMTGISGVLALLAACALPASAAPRLNDTGATRCVDQSGALGPSCAGSGQDGESGRDARHPKDFDGHAGFRFRKIDGDGRALDGAAMRWRCVRDAVTGLTWEVKTDGGGAYGRDKVYTNYGDGRPGDTRTLIDLANRDALCGARDWRLPTLLELQSLVDYGRADGAAIDRRWFPHTAPQWVWSSTRYATDTDASWAVFFDAAAFGGDGAGNHVFKLAARLVRGPVADTRADRFVVDGAEATDTLTGLVWRRCPEGQVFAADRCTGVALARSWAQALTIAREEARRTGVAWRLPNAKELATLADRTRIDPALDPAVFPDTPRGPWYWSSTPVAADPSLAYANEFSGGYTGSYPARAGALGVRLVRDADPAAAR